MRLQHYIMEDTIADLTKPYDSYRLECDGLTRVLSYVLDQSKIKHQVFQGLVEYTKDSIPLHFWIVLKDGRTIDYRAQMWLGKHKDVPHGVFKQKDFPHIVYKGKPIRMHTTTQIFQVLTM